MADKRYGALRFAARFYRFVGWLTIIGGVLSALLVLLLTATRYEFTGDALVSTPATPQFLTAGALLLGAIVLAVGWFAAGDLCQLFMDVEANTRTTRELLQRRTRRPE